MPHTKPHQADEVHLPWKVAINCLKLEVWNLLVNRCNHSPRQANERIFKANTCYDELIDTVFKILLNESGGCLSVAIGRNPTLIFGAIQLFRATKIKTNIHDETLTISAMALRAPKHHWVITP